MVSIRRQDDGLTMLRKAGITIERISVSKTVLIYRSVIMDNEFGLDLAIEDSFQTNENAARTASYDIFLKVQCRPSSLFIDQLLSIHPLMSID